MACVLDVNLRKIVSRAMGMKIDGKLTLAALKDALSKITPAPGWVPSLEQRLEIPRRRLRQIGFDCRRRDQLFR